MKKSRALKLLNINEFRNLQAGINIIDIFIIFSL